VSSAKGSYDTERNQVIQMAAKVAVLDRVLSLYGPETKEARVKFRASMEDAIRRLWPQEKMCGQTLLRIFKWVTRSILRSMPFRQPMTRSRNSRFG